MALESSTRLGPYEIIAPLGAGGMGEVWRALDTRLNREVAIKILPASFANDKDRLRRFGQEALATSALNHPNILTIYDIGTASTESGGSPYIVAELLEGADLRARLNDGALPVRKAIDYAQQITRGLAAAHEKGIVHRDLKPENLFITKDGRVKILDFGLAKLTQQKLGHMDTQAPTSPLSTQSGVVMGTVFYMSPEQTRGERADYRADIFAFGAIVYELVTGQRAFQGKSAVEVMNAILKEEPPELSETSHKIPVQLERIVRRCLEKKPEQRFQSTSDLGFALEALTTPSGSQLEAAAAVVTESTSKTRLFGNARLAWVVAAALLLATLGLAWAYFWLRPAPDAGVIKLSLPPPEKASFGSFAVSPDGRRLAFTATTGGQDQLWVRPLEATGAQPLAGTEGASFPFWSPDSRFVGFFASGKLKKIEVSGGPVQTLCDAGASAALGGTWNRDEVIIFATIGDGLSQVPAAGGIATAVTSVDRARQEATHYFPSFLPDGRHFLYYIRSGQKEASGIYLGSLDGEVKQRLLGADLNAVYAPPGYLLFLREGTLLAQPFDADQLRLTGEPFAVAERVGSDPNYNHGNFSASDNGVLVYDPSLNRQSKQLVWADRGGKRIGSLGVGGSYNKTVLSPDEKRVVIVRLGTQTDDYDLWLQNVGGAASRFTFDPRSDISPVWSPDGSRIVWASIREGHLDLYQKAASGAGQDELLLKSSFNKLPTHWSSDGRFIVYFQVDPRTGRDVWVLPLAGDRQPFPFLKTEVNETGAQLSPDGRWMAYVSDESGGNEVYVQSFPEPGGKKQVSTKGGWGPHWRRDGKELYYYAPDGKLMAVEVKSGASSGGGFEAGAPVALFQFHAGGGPAAAAPYTVTGDGQRFLLNTLVDESGAAPLTVVLNWAGEMTKN